MKIITSNQFNKDLKLIKKRGYKLNDLNIIIEYLKHGISLPEKNKNHLLIGNYKNFYECHIRPDWLLIYTFDFEGNVYLLRTGTHADLFD